MYDSTIGGGANGVRTDWSATVRLVLGTALILAGIALTIWLATTIYAMTWGEGVPSVVANLTPQSQEDVALVFPDGEYVLAHKVFPVIGYVLTVLMLMVGAALVKATLAGGAALLRAVPAVEARTTAQPSEASLPLEPYSTRRGL